MYGEMRRGRYSLKYQDMEEFVVEIFKDRENLAEILEVEKQCSLHCVEEKMFRTFRNTKGPAASRVIPVLPVY